MLTREIQRRLSDTRAIAHLEKAIAAHTRGLLAQNDSTTSFSDGDVLIVPPRYRPFGPMRLIIATSEGKLESASNLFNPERWTDAYRSRPPGYVCSKPEAANEVRIAARAVFLKEFGLNLTSAADIQVYSRSNAFTAIPDTPEETFLPIEPDIDPKPQGRPRTLYIRASDLHLPGAWRRDGDKIGSELARKLRFARPEGLSRGKKEVLLKAIEALSHFQNTTYLGASFAHLKIGDEAALQRQLRELLRAAKYQISEGTSVGGGNIDLLFEDEIVLEVKIYSRPTDTPMNVGSRYSLQARRYALALSTDIVCTVVGYKPKTRTWSSLSRRAH